MLAALCSLRIALGTEASGSATCPENMALAFVPGGITLAPFLYLRFVSCHRVCLLIRQRSGLRYTLGIHRTGSAQIATPCLDNTSWSKLRIRGTEN